MGPHDSKDVSFSVWLNNLYGKLLAFFQLRSGMSCRRLKYLGMIKMSSIVGNFIMPSKACSQ